MHIKPYHLTHAVNQLDGYEVGFTLYVGVFEVYEKEMLKAMQGNHKPQQSASGFYCVY